MNRPLLNFQLIEADSGSAAKNRVANVLPFSLAGNDEEIGKPLFSLPASALALRYSQAVLGQNDKRPLDYLVIGTLAILVHVAIFDHFHNANFQQELIESVKVPPKVEITLVKPQPKPVIQPPPPPPPPKVLEKPKPPVPKAVPLKPKPKVKPKIVEKTVEPPPILQPAPVVESKAPVSSQPAPPAPAPKPPVEEKVTEPKAGASYLHNPAPEYPEAAMDRGLEGKVLMKVHVQPNGKPDTINVTKSSGHSMLDDAAVRTVKQWSFVPAMRGKTPIAGWVTVPITFNLQN